MNLGSVALCTPAVRMVVIQVELFFQTNNPTYGEFVEEPTEDSDFQWCVGVYPVLAIRSVVKGEIVLSDVLFSGAQYDYCLEEIGEMSKPGENELIRVVTCNWPEREDEHKFEYIIKTMKEAIWFLGTRRQNKANPPPTPPPILTATN